MVLTVNFRADEATACSPIVEANNRRVALGMTADDLLCIASTIAATKFGVFKVTGRRRSSLSSTPMEMNAFPLPHIVAGNRKAHNSRRCHRQSDDTPE
jgi:hypothetical protein